MSMYTDGRYGQRNPTWHEEDAVHKAQAIADLLRFGGLEPPSIVDVGCGTGRVLLELKDILDRRDLRSISYEGWDIAPEAVKKAREREGHRIKFVCEDFLASERVVDLILCIDTFEHVSDDVGFLAALAKRADWFVFRIPLDLSALDVMRPKRLIAARRNWGHRHVYSRALALEVLGEAGFQVQTERYHRISKRFGGLDPVRRALFRVDPHRAVRAFGGFSLMVLATR